MGGMGTMESRHRPRAEAVDLPQNHAKRPAVARDRGDVELHHLRCHPPDGDWVGRVAIWAAVVVFVVSVPRKPKIGLNIVEDTCENRLPKRQVLAGCCWLPAVRGLTFGC